MERHPLNEHTYWRSVRFAYFALVYLVLLWINAANVDFAAAAGGGYGNLLFLVNAFASYNALYLLPALVLTWLAGRPWPWRWLRLPRGAVLAANVTAVLTGALTTLFFYANAKIHALYGMFINGFVVNLVMTPGGLESLGGSASSTLGFALIGLAFFLGHALLFLLLAFSGRRFALLRWEVRRLARPLLVLLLFSMLGDHSVHAYASAMGKSDVLELTQEVPFYVGTTARSLFKKLGFEVAAQEKSLDLEGRLQYPAKPLEFTKPEKPYNIVWLVAESWRADTLDPEIMPATWAFAQKAQVFANHYSGGNGTRIGIFTMMTGLPGTYWDAFLKGRRGAPLIEVLQQQGYQMSLYTSAKFSYPEFDQTVFSQVPREQLHEIDAPLAGWEKDRQNVSDLLKFIDTRDPARPFFAWMFFESPHARYYFPPESVIRTPYRDDINYATLDRDELQKDIVPIKNRYLNAVHHLDSQFARILEYLETHGLLENTLVVMLGDHGEEFMENGYWGHNSTFSDPQTRTPLILWIPGRAPAVHEQLSSHLDVVPTLMPLLGVKNPPEDYSSGYDLFSGKRREYVVFSDWSRVGYKDADVKIALPTKMQGFVGKRISGPNDEELAPQRAQELLQSKQPQLVRLMQELGRFNQKKTVQTVSAGE